MCFNNPELVPYTPCSLCWCGSCRFAVLEPP